MCQMEFKVHRSPLTGRGSLAWAVGCVASPSEGPQETPLMAVPSSPAPAHQPRLSCTWGITSCCSKTTAPSQDLQTSPYPEATILQRGLNPSLGKGTPFLSSKSLPCTLLLQPWLTFQVLFPSIELLPCFSFVILYVTHPQLIMRLLSPDCPQQGTRSELKNESSRPSKLDQW